MIINDQIQYFISVFYNHKVVRCGREVTSHYCKLGMSFLGIMSFMLHFVIHASFRQNGEVSSGMAKRECFGEGGGSCEGG